MNNCYAGARELGDLINKSEEATRYHDAAARLELADADTKGMDKTDPLFLEWQAAAEDYERLIDGVFDILSATIGASVTQKACGSCAGCKKS